jgi:phosphoribosylcarboxyaminoimidazole (NCAIR) mutase
MNRGVPTTDPKARTGEFTPPGVAASARLKSAADSATVSGAGSAATLDGVAGSVLTPPVCQAPVRARGHGRHAGVATARTMFMMVVICAPPLMA